MKRLTITIAMVGLFLALAGISVAQTDSSDEDLILQAESAFQTGDYDRAIQLFSAIVSRHPEQAAAHYNLGNAYFQSRQNGQALLSFLRAQRLDPRNPSIARALTLIRATRAEFQTDESYWLSRLASSTYGTVTTTELTVLTALAWASLFLLFALRLLVQRWRRAILLGLAVGGLSLSILGFTLMARLYIDETRPKGVVVALSTDVYSGPGEDYLVMFETFGASEVRLLESRDNWRLIVLPDGRQGWVREEAVAIV